MWCAGSGYFCELDAAERGRSSMFCILRSFQACTNGRLSLEFLSKGNSVETSEHVDLVDALVLGLLGVSRLLSDWDLGLDSVSWSCWVATASSLLSFRMFIRSSSIILSSRTLSTKTSSFNGSCGCRLIVDTSLSQDSDVVEVLSKCCSSSLRYSDVIVAIEEEDVIGMVVSGSLGLSSMGISGGNMGASVTL